ncbi:MAG TPA: hypothetical protein PL009_01255 [Flavipsychrobacter sp.]|nr:hypothetical protein [Flavipsychrobacter sp.]
MALRILMTGNDSNLLKVDGEMLRLRGFRIYLCEKDMILDAMIEEVKPDILFINSKVQDKQTTNLYHRLIDKITFASLPVIYTLSEDDVYLVNRKRTVMKERRYNMTDNIVDAIKMALTPLSSSSKKRVKLDASPSNNIRPAYRA